MYTSYILLKGAPIQTQHHTKKHHCTTHTHTQDVLILAVTYNISMTFGPHINKITNNRLNALRALGGTSFSKNKETLTLIYKQCIRSVMKQNSLDWREYISPSSAATITPHYTHTDTGWDFQTLALLARWIPTQSLTF